MSAEFNAWAEKQTYKQEALKVKKLILDEDWWEDLILMDKLFKPIVKLLKLVDSDLPSMGKVRHSLQCPAREPSLLSSCMRMRADCSHAFIIMLAEGSPACCRCTSTAQ